MSNGLEHLKGTDIYVLDQVMRGRIGKGARILDVGCGSGRNLRYFLGAGHDVYAADVSEERVRQAQTLCAELRSELPAENIRVEAAEDLSFEAGTFDFVICNAVLHFARDREHFEEMLRGCWEMLAPEGVLFVRTASLLGIPPDQRGEIGSQLQPDGDTRFLIDEAFLAELEEDLKARRIDPFKTTIVHGKRAMATWVLARA
ncbi:MAG: tellurite methyltransferase [Planctomycetota bacterium]|jgi:tellurite methyltransferase